MALRHQRKNRHKRYERKGGVKDTTPNSFSIAALTNQQLGALVTSAVVTVAGVDSNASCSIAGDSTAQFKVFASNGTTVVRDWARTNTTVVNGQKVQLRLTTSALNSTAKTATLNIGGVTGTWSVTTLSDTIPAAFTFTDLTGAALETEYTSDKVAITGIDAATAISVTGGEYQIYESDGTTVVTAWRSSASTITNGQKVELRVTSSASNATAVTITLTVGGVSDTWSVTTLADTIPAAFSFMDLTNQALDTLITSNTVEITGIAAAAAVSITGGQFQIYQSDGETVVTAWGSAASTVTNGQKIALRTTSSASNDTAVSVVLTVGGVSDTWTVTTVAAG